MLLDSTYQLYTPLPPDGGVFFSLFAGGGGVGGTPLVEDLVRLLVSLSAAPLSSLCPKPCKDNIGLFVHFGDVRKCV